MVSLQTIYTWFKTKAKPTEAQFRATWDSFWHKSEAIPVDRIEGIDSLISDKADNDLLVAHINDDTVHVTPVLQEEIAAKVDDNELHSVAKSGNFLELNNKNIIPFGEFLIFKAFENDPAQFLEVEDFAEGFLAIDHWIFGKYLGGNVGDIDSWEIFTEYTIEENQGINYDQIGVNGIHPTPVNEFILNEVQSSRGYITLYDDVNADGSDLSSIYGYVVNDQGKVDSSPTGGIQIAIINGSWLDETDDSGGVINPQIGFIEQQQGLLTVDFNS